MMSVRIKPEAGARVRAIGENVKKSFFVIGMIGKNGDDRIF
jgi:hypothetical protein